MKIIVSLIILLLIISCNSIFHEEDNEYNVIDKQEEKINLINGLYSRLVKVHNEYYFCALIRGDDFDVYRNWSFTKDGSTSSSYGGPVIDFPKITGTIYRNLYALIITANSLLPKLSNTKEDLELKGEIYFLRAYSYFKLARLFGYPPIVNDADVNYLIEKPEYADVYRFIEKDMLKALELLPNNPTEARIPFETPHKGAAKALLAEIYLSWAGYPINDQSKYKEAAQLSGEVIQNADSYNLGILTDISYLWKANNKHNNENIFGLYFNAIFHKYDPKNLVLYETENNVNIWGHLASCYIPEFKFFEKYPKNYRKNCTLRTRLGSAMYPGADINPLKEPSQYLWSCRYYKWYDPDSVAKGPFFNFYQGSSTTLYLLRYAQTLLTFAEASARSGNLNDSAFEAVNMIRRRANKIDIGTPSKFDLQKTLTLEQFLDSVVWERAWELCFEPEGRWFDILRLDLKSQLPNYSYPNDPRYKVPAQLLTNEWYFYKIPEEDRLINPNFSN